MKSFAGMSVFIYTFEHVRLNFETTVEADAVQLVGDVSGF